MLLLNLLVIAVDWRTTASSVPSRWRRRLRRSRSRTRPWRRRWFRFIEIIGSSEGGFNSTDSYGFVLSTRHCNSEVDIVPANDSEGSDVWGSEAGLYATASDEDVGT